MDDQRLDHAFARLAAEGDDPLRLDEPLRTLVIVCSAQGVLDNGGLRYFFGNDWPAAPPYEVFVRAYERIGASASARRLARAAALITSASPQLDRDGRVAVLESPAADVLDALEREGDAEDVWALLAAHAATHAASLPSV